MRPGNCLKNKTISLRGKLKELKIYSLSRSCDFHKRRFRKIDPLNLILSFYNCNLAGDFSLGNWAFQISQLVGKSISKQAIFERLNIDFIKLCRQLLANSFSSKIKAGKLLNRFNNVYIQDSSCVHLPNSIYQFYQGSKSIRGNHSVAKIQVIYNLVKSSFEELSVSSFTRNDQAASIDILKYVRPGDLIVRDLGYFVISTLKEIIKRKAHFICPLRKDVNLFYTHNQQRINLRDLLKKRRFIKKQILLGADHRLPVTLIAIKLDEKTTKYRQRSAIYDRDRRNKITAKKLFLLGWDIFICSCSDLNPSDIQDVYRIRWQIEIIFKSWKSHLKLEESIPVRLKRPFIPEAIIYLTLLLTVVFIMPVYRWALKMSTQISLIKLTKFIATIMPLSQWRISKSQLLNNQKLIVYELRNRANFRTKLQLLS